MSSKTEFKWEDRLKFIIKHTTRWQYNIIRWLRWITLRIRKEIEIRENKVFKGVTWVKEKWKKGESG